MVLKAAAALLFSIPAICMEGETRLPHQTTVAMYLLRIQQDDRFNAEAKKN
jgi:hypothetical protein